VVRKSLLNPSLLPSFTQSFTIYIKAGCWFLF
jgi:hypothetical protein